MPADRDAFCPHCGYNLRGVASRRCPECGKPFDPAKLATSLIPWVHRRRIGRIRAFLKTVMMATFRPRRLSLEMVRPASYSDARRFRWTVIILVALVLTLMHGAYVGYVETGRRLATLLIVVTAPFAIACTAVLALGTALPSWFCRPKHLEPAQRCRASTLSHYTAAPLALLILPGAYCMAWRLSLVSGRDPFASLPAALRMAWIIPLIVVMLLWFTGVLTTISITTHRSTSGAALIGVAILVLWPLLGAILIGLPAAAIMYWILMYYSLI